MIKVHEKARMLTREYGSPVAGGAEIIATPAAEHISYFASHKIVVAPFRSVDDIDSHQVVQVKGRLFSCILESQSNCGVFVLMFLKIFRSDDLFRRNPRTVLYAHFDQLFANSFIGAA